MPRGDKSAHTDKQKRPERRLQTVIADLGIIDLPGLMISTTQAAVKPVMPPPITSTSHVTFCCN
jgi:hypothetical protein